MDIDVISLFEPECGARESECVQAVLDSGRWSDGPMVEAFERAFAAWVGRRHAVAVGSGTLGTWIALRALGIGAGDEVVCASHSWHQVAQAITLAGATAVFADIDYWSGSLSPEKPRSRSARAPAPCSRATPTATRRPGSPARAGADPWAAAHRRQQRGPGFALPRPERGDVWRRFGV